MLIFERMKSADGGIDITTICDPDKGAKVRGLYQSISFHITPDRTVSICQEVVQIPDYSKKAAKKGRLSEEDIQDYIRKYLQAQSEPVSQNQLLAAFKDEPRIPYHALRNTLTACAVLEHAEMPKGQIFMRNGGVYNRKTYGVKQ
jgi:hypothetical protein